MDIQVGDRVTYQNKLNEIKKAIIKDDEMAILFKVDKKYIKVLKIERPKYETIEEKKELLTEEEKDFLKQYIKIIENLNNGEVKEIYREETYLRLYLKTGLDYKIEVGTKFSNMKLENTYTLEELGLKSGGITNEYR